MSVKDTRADLLERSIQYVADNGFSNVSLRQLGAALGTSHRMLIHYFGSKERLWVEIIQTVERRQRELMATIVPDPELSIGEAMWAFWKHISDPALWPNERLFFEIYGQALQGRPNTTELLDGVVEAWIGPAVAVAVARGVRDDVATAQARLGIAVTRGLLLDLLATRDVAAVDQAMKAFIALVEAGFSG